MKDKYIEIMERELEKEENLDYLIGYDCDGNEVHLPKDLLMQKFKPFFRR